MNRIDLPHAARPAVIILCALSMLFVGCEPPPAPPPEPARVPVTSEVVAPSVFQPRLLLVGRVAAASRQDVRAPAAGRIGYPARFAGGLRTGAEVRRGERLFVVAAPAIELRLAEARLSAKAARTALERARRGVEEGFQPQAELEQRMIEAELAEERLANAVWESEQLEVAAPSSGILLVDTVVPPGAEVTADAVVAELAGEGRPRIEAWASAADLDRLETGLAVEARRASGEVVALGQIAELDRHVDDGGVARVVVEVEEDRALPRPGEGVELDVLLSAREAALTVPERSLRISGSLTSVFVLEEHGAESRAAARLVQVGGRSGGRAEIVDGVEAGERIAVDGAEYLSDGVQVRDLGPDPSARVGDGDA